MNRLVAQLLLAIALFNAAHYGAAEVHFANDSEKQVSSVTAQDEGNDENSDDCSDCHHCDSCGLGSCFLGLSEVPSRIRLTLTSTCNFSTPFFFVSVDQPESIDPPIA